MSSAGETMGWDFSGVGKFEGLEDGEEVWSEEVFVAVEEVPFPPIAPNKLIITKTIKT